MNPEPYSYKLSILPLCHLGTSHTPEKSCQGLQLTCQWRRKMFYLNTSCSPASRLPAAQLPELSSLPPNETLLTATQESPLAQVHPSHKKSLQLKNNLNFRFQVWIKPGFRQTHKSKICKNLWPLNSSLMISFYYLFIYLFIMYSFILPDIFSIICQHFPL